MIDLPVRELESLVGENTLQRLEGIIPFIPESGVRDPNDIYKSKYLEKIFLAFAGQDALSKKDFRRLLLSRLSDEDIRVLARELNLNSTLPFREVANSILHVTWGDNKQTRIFINFFGFPEHFIPSPRLHSPNVEYIKAPESPYKILKDFQFDICKKSLKRMENPLQKLLIQMPTGSGKTRTAMEIISIYLNENSGKSILWLANSEELHEQAIESFKDVWSHVGNFDVDVVRAYGSYDLIIPTKSSFIVGGFQKFYSLFSKTPELAEKLSEQIVLIIIDEAHQVIAPTYMQVIELLMKPNYHTHLIGLTATPGRGNVHNPETGLLIDFFERNKIEIESGDTTVFEFLRNRGVLSRIKRSPLVTGKKFELTPAEKEHLKTHFDFPKSFLDKLSSDDWRNVQIIKKMLSVYGSDKKVLFFAGSVDQSKLVCATLNFLDIRAEHVDGTTKRDRRRNIIEQFKEGNLNIICNYGVLTTGFDAPKTDIIFIARPTMSIVLYSQMVGRGLRGPAIGGKSECMLIEVRDEIEECKQPDNVYEYFNDYWEQNV